MFGRNTPHSYPREALPDPADPRASAYCYAGHDDLPENCDDNSFVVHGSDSESDSGEEYEA